MKKLFTGALAALTLATASLAGGAQAAAWGGGDYGHGYGGGWGHGGGWNRGGALVGAGLLGLVVGAAVASSAHPVYAAPAYYPAPVEPVTYYYGPPPAYYAGPYYYGYISGAPYAWHWDGYGHHYVYMGRR